jgi:hypothetical protein
MLHDDGNNPTLCGRAAVGHGCVRRASLVYLEKVSMTTPSSGADTQAARLERVERENRLLRERLDKLEKRTGSNLASLIGNIILLVSAGLLLDYLGVFPSAVQRLPLKAKTVEAEQYRLVSEDGTPLGIIQVSGDQTTITRYGPEGQPVKKELPPSKP